MDVGVPSCGCQWPVMKYLGQIRVPAYRQAGLSQIFGVSFIAKNILRFKQFSVYEPVEETVFAEMARSSCFRYFIDYI